MSTPEDGAYEYPRLRPVEVLPTTLRGQQVFCLRDPMHYTDAIVSVPPQTAAILDLFDGRHSLLDIQEAFARRFGVLLFREQLQQVIQSLDDCLLLESPRFAGHREALEDAFRRAPHRPARLAGTAYPSDPEALRRELNLPNAKPEASRRNVYTRGVDLNTLIGRTFEVQGVHFAGVARPVSKCVLFLNE